MTMMQPAAPGAPSTQEASQLVKSASGQMRMDFPKMSVITNPAMQHVMLLDHVKQEFKIVPMQMPDPKAPHPPGMPHLPGMPNMPALPQIPGMPHPPAMHVQDLGKSVIGGMPVEGKQYTMQMPTLPAIPKTPALAIPGMPKPPAAPKIPGMPQAPAMPQAPGMPKPPEVPKPPMPTVAEVWSSTATGLPVMSKITGEFGTQTMSCQTTPIPEPPAATFQPPPHYKLAV
jgi:hypothetical protein